MSSAINTTLRAPTVSSATTPSRRLEITLSIVIALAVVLVFWTQQRYPALLKRLHAGTGVKVQGVISFDALMKVTPDMPATTRIFRTSVNWIYTNRFGMYFALPFGAAIMTLLAGSMAPRRFSSTAGNVLCGVVAGSPLGVCTNCATPVAQSLLVSGASTRLTVAAMISSPSFNPIVLTMAFVLFPLPVALLRLIVPGLLVAVLPLLIAENPRKLIGLNLPHEQKPPGKRLLAFFTAYFRNLLRLALLTLPWMILAAVLGAMAAELIPAYGTQVPVSTLGVIAVAIFGTFLPVPMALDVALAYVLYHAGVPTPYVVALLCTLGPASIYSLSAIGQQLGRRASLQLAGALALLGSVAGIVSMSFPEFVR